MNCPPSVSTTNTALSHHLNQEIRGPNLKKNLEFGSNADGGGAVIQRILPLFHGSEENFADGVHRNEQQISSQYNLPLHHYQVPNTSISEYDSPTTYPELDLFSGLDVNQQQPIFQQQAQQPIFQQQPQQQFQQQQLDQFQQQQLDQFQQQQPARYTPPFAALICPTLTSPLSATSAASSFALNSPSASRSPTGSEIARVVTENFAVVEAAVATTEAAVAVAAAEAAATTSAESSSSDEEMKDPDPDAIDPREWHTGSLLEYYGITTSKNLIDGLSKVPGIFIYTTPPNAIKSYANTFPPPVYSITDDGLKYHCTFSGRNRMIPKARNLITSHFTRQRNNEASLITIEEKIQALCADRIKVIGDIIEAEIISKIYDDYSGERTKENMIIEDVKVEMKRHRRLEVKKLRKAMKRKHRELLSAGSSKRRVYSDNSSSDNDD